MPTTYSIHDHRPIWIALSELYLDTELQAIDYQHIASVIQQSPYSLKQVKLIDRNEVFPVLFNNGLSVAGEWTGFDPDWLVTCITESLSNQNIFKRIRNRIAFRIWGGMTQDNWRKIEQAYRFIQESETKSGTHLQSR